MTTTDADGRYSVSNLPRGTYVLTAVKTGYTFDGNFRVVNLVANIEENFDASAQDAFENDDTCAQAKAIDPNGTVQAHTFHQTNDEDWVKFDAIAGMRYQIVGNIPISSTADVSLEIYARCELRANTGRTGCHSAPAAVLRTHRLPIPRSF